MFVGAGIDGPKYGPRETALFFRAMALSPDPLAMAYYRIEGRAGPGRVRQAGLRRGGRGAETKADAARLVKGMFTPRNSLDRARETDALLRSAGGQPGQRLVHEQAAPRAWRVCGGIAAQAARLKARRSAATRSQAGSEKI